MNIQSRVVNWLWECFGGEAARDPVERVHRFAEEALELGQACGMTMGEWQELLEYVYGRAPGEIGQEVGGVMVTLAGLCGAQGVSMEGEADREICRIESDEVMEKIRAKQASKPAVGPLPGCS